MNHTVCLTFDYYTEAHSVAFPLMNARGLVGTWFVDPETIDAVGGPTRDNLTLLKMFGWTIGAYSGINLVSALSNNRNTVMDRFVRIKSVFASKGFNVRSLAPNQRSWNMALRNLSDGLFERVRVAADTIPQPFPIPDHLYIKNGGTASLGASDTPDSLNKQVTEFLSKPPGLWSVVVHKVGPVADDYTITPAVFSALLDRLATEQLAGKLRVVGYDDI